MRSVERRIPATERGHSCPHQRAQVSGNRQHWRHPLGPTCCGQECPRSDDSTIQRFNVLTIDEHITRS
jgi:hypothetical protein